MKLAISAGAIGTLALLAGCAVETHPQYPAQPVTYVAPTPAYVVPAVPAATTAIKSPRATARR